MATRTPNARNPKKASKGFPYAVMEERPKALDALDISFRWGGYGFRVLRCHLAVFPPSHTISLHKHSEYEFHFIPRGRGKVGLPDGEYELREGLFYLTGPDVLHYQETDAEDPMSELCLHIDIVELNEPGLSGIGGVGGFDALEHEEARRCVEELRRLPAKPVNDQWDAMSWFLTAYRAWHENDPFFHSTVKHAIIQILLRSVRAFRNRRMTSLPARDMSRHRYQLAVQYIQDNYASPLSLDEVAERVQVSGRQLQRVFREHGDVSFSEYLETVRLKRVCEQLRRPDLTIEQIAVNNGFTNGNYLFSVFKKRLGVTPGEYKRKEGIL
ncbi:AraC family transcriptional regulator [Paenibacillus thermotolerans]|uniref:AraC family transcriptional regulator n=1 Tax=Paenibacillus thermotolerans TaxID=3027807 RepID=UPI00236891DE|nr:MULTISPECIES: AraC family transcriptional regulator [unclassified Paenibacillus]